MATNKRHVYDYSFDPGGNNAPAKVLKMVGNNKRVLEIGAGPGSITKHLINTNKCNVTAIEIDQDAISLLSSYTSNVYQCDLNSDDWPSVVIKHGLFEVVLAGDVLEHLYDPWATLNSMKNLLTKDGYIVVSIPNAAHNSVISCLLNEDFEYREWGLLDRTHIRFFGLKNIQSMFDQVDLAIMDAEYITAHPEDTEFAASWRVLPIRTRNALLARPYGSVYQVVLKACRRNSNISGLNLTSIPSPKIKNHYLKRCIKLAARRLPILPNNPLK